MKIKDTSNRDSRFELPEAQKDLDLPVGHLSVSSVEMYLRCAKQFWFRYCVNIKTPPDVALTEGKSHHGTQETNNRNFIRKGNFLKSNDQVTCFCDTFNTFREEDKLKISKDDERVILSRGKALIEMYAREVMPSVIPIAVEELCVSFIKDNESGKRTPLVSYIDVVEPGCISDYKVIGKKKTKQEVDDSLQLTVYSALKRKRRSRFISFVKTKIPKVDVQDAVVDKVKLEHARKVITSVADGIRRGSFPMCTPTSWCCTPRFCGYYNRCHGIPDKVQIQGGL